MTKNSLLLGLCLVVPLGLGGPVGCGDDTASPAPVDGGSDGPSTDSTVDAPSDAHANDSPTNDSPASDSPANDSPASDSPASDSPSSDSPADAPFDSPADSPVDAAADQAADGGADAAADADAGGATVTVGPNGTLTFAPATLTIGAGTTVTWVWAASGHTVTSGTYPNADNQFCSPNDTNCGLFTTSNAGAMYSHTFPTAGTFPYFCHPHGGAGMTGQIIVQ